MIFVTVGTNEAPFERLLRAVDLFPRGEAVIVQHGHSRTRPARAQCVDFLAFERLIERVRAARAVVTHAGVGSIMVALANEKRPIVVPRLRRLGEAVDDHQAELGRVLHATGLVTFVEDPNRLGEVLARPTHAVAARPSGGSALAEELLAYLSDEIPSFRAAA